MLSADETSYTCGATLKDLEMPEVIQEDPRRLKIEMQQHRCGEQMETLYYTNPANDVICVHCASDMELNWEYKTAITYPKCEECSTRPDVYIKGRRRVNADN